MYTINAKKNPVNYTQKLDQANRKSFTRRPPPPLFDSWFARDYKKRFVTHQSPSPLQDEKQIIFKKKKNW